MTRALIAAAITAGLYALIAAAIEFGGVLDTIAYAMPNAPKGTNS